MNKVMLSLAMAVQAFAADMPKAEPTALPTISAELRAKFWRANAEAMAAQARMEQAKAAMQAAQDALTKACGDTFQLAAGQDGEPTCVVRPAPPKAEKPTTK